MASGASKRAASSEKKTPASSKARAASRGKKGGAKSGASGAPKKPAASPPSKSATPRSGPEESGSTTGSLAGLPARLVDTWATVLVAAATVAEKELAFGIKAAKFIEGRILKVDELRSETSSPLLGKWRRDSHEMLDLFVDAVTISVNSIANRGGSVLGLRTGTPEKPTRSAGEQLLVLQMPGPLEPGQAGERILRLENDGGATTRFTPLGSDLLSASGDRIPAGCIYFEPPGLTVEGFEAVEMVVGVSVPDDTPAGHFEGLVNGMPGGAQRALIQVSVS